MGVSLHKFQGKFAMREKGGSAVMQLQKGIITAAALVNALFCLCCSAYLSSLSASLLDSPSFLLPCALRVGRHLSLTPATSILSTLSLLQACCLAAAILTGALEQQQGRSELLWRSPDLAGKIGVPNR